MLDMGYCDGFPTFTAPAYAVSGSVAQGAVAGRGLCLLRRRTGRWTHAAGILADGIRHGGRDGRGCP